MPDFREYDDVVFIAGVTFTSEYGVHEAGTEVEEASRFPNLQVLIDSHFVYPVAPDKGYAYLPPHLFNHINVRDEIMAKIEGALSPNLDHFQDGKPAEVLQAEAEADQARKDPVDRKAAQEQARKQYEDLRTPDVNPAAADKASDAKKLHKGDKAAWELLEEEAEKADEDAEKADESTEKPKKATRTTKRSSSKEK